MEIPELNLNKNPEMENEKAIVVEKKNEMYFIPTGNGTVVDNYLILKVKEGKFSLPKLQNVLDELAQYQPAFNELVGQFPETESLVTELMKIHEHLWSVEDRKREIEKAEDHDTMIARLLLPNNSDELFEYLTLCRDISFYNDRRAQIKAEINRVSGSKIAEVKAHKTV